jgi:hypothetical protein
MICVFLGITFQRRDLAEDLVDAIWPVWTSQDYAFRLRALSYGGRVGSNPLYALQIAAVVVRNQRRSKPLFFFDSGAPIGDKPAMAKKPGTNPKGELAFFDVVYDDGSQRSNRRVPAELLGGLDGDEPARGYILEQDREIAEKSGRPPLAIMSISRIGAKRK